MAPESPGGRPEEAVAVRMFDFDYEIKSDRPDVVRILAADVDRAAEAIKAATPGLDRGQFNWPVQVAFQMAMERHDAQEELARCQDEVARLTRRLEAALEA